MPRPRNAENKGLPARWRLIHGAYYFQVPTGLETHWDGKKQFRLGKTLPEAYATWASRLGSLDQARNIGQLLDRYSLEVVPTKAPRTQHDNHERIGRIRAVFGENSLEFIKPQHVYLYVDKASSKTVARKDMKVFSHVYTKAVEWGYIDRHPFKGQVRMEGGAPRDRYIEDWELVECLKLASKRKKGSVRMVQAYIRIKLLAGLRRGDLLRLAIADLQDDGIHVTPNKTKNSTGKKLVIEWSDELRQAVADAKAVRPVDIAPWLFCTRKGECYIDEETGTASSFDSVWQRFMDRVLQESKVKERFTEHDLRAKCASDAESLERARQLLAHADSRVTDRFYRRKPERVKPLR